ncbi:MAG: hypothetical protein GY855_02900 [candidate division Zixibacteria bacterium]|nr:hypothetical protein [candidate division Zixibacteria bacterium]
MDDVGCSDPTAQQCARLIFRLTGLPNLSLQAGQTFLSGAPQLAVG